MSSLATPLPRPALVSRRRLRLSAAWLGAGIVAGFAATAVLAPLVAPYHPTAYVAAPLLRPTGAYLLGTNDVGQDILSELIYGARVSLTVALLGAGLSLALALLVGVSAATVGGWFDALLMRVVDVFMAVPHLPLMIVLAAFLGPGLNSVILVVVLVMWAGPARVIRAQVLTLRERAHVKSARLLGGSHFYLMRRHLLPAVTPVAAAAFVSLAGRAVMMEAGLAFLGLGDPTLKSWGGVLRAALNFDGIYLTPYWLWWALPAGACISLLVVGFTLWGTALERYGNARVDRLQTRA